MKQKQTNIISTWGCSKATVVPKCSTTATSMLMSSVEPDSTSLYSSGELITCGVGGKLRLTGSRISLMVTVKLAVIENTVCWKLTSGMSNMKCGWSDPLCRAETFYSLKSSGQRQTFMNCIFYSLGLDHTFYRHLEKKKNPCFKFTLTKTFFCWQGNNVLNCQIWATICSWNTCFSVLKSKQT